MVVLAIGFIPNDEDSKLSKKSKILLLIIVLATVIATIISLVIMTQN